MSRDIINSCFFGGVKNGKKAVWEITERCQLKCQHCCNEHRRDGRELSLDQAKDIVDELHEHSIDKLILTGGDPLMYANVIELIDYAKTKDMKVSISTNGIMLDLLSEKLKKVKPDKLIIGLDGFSSKSNDVFRGIDGAFNTVMTGINKLKNSGIKIDIHCVITTLNINEIASLSEYCAENDFELSLSSLVEIEEKPMISKFVVSDEVRLNELYSTKFKSKVKFVRNASGSLGDCDAGKNIIGVKANGMYTPCLWISNFTDVFESYSIKEAFSFNKECVLDSEKCSSCDDKECKKGCPAVAMSINYNLDPLCVEYKQLCEKKSVI